MRGIGKLYEKVKKSKLHTAAKMGFVCRNYDTGKGGKWTFFLDDTPDERTEIYFPTQEAAVEYGESLLSDSDTLIVLNI